MNLKDAIASLSSEHPEDTLLPLYTPWGERLKDITHAEGCTKDRIEEAVWPEYPRPQMQREQYQMLNGKWTYAIRPVEQPGPDNVADGEILVPFSPESPLSGVSRQLLPNQILWYQRQVLFPPEELQKKAQSMRCLLHFGAVDQQATVYANGCELITHTGGYLPFTVDLTDFVSELPLLLQVKVRDESDTSYHARGKQTLKRGGMFYTAQSGIWQSVWYEWVPEKHIAQIRISPDYDRRCVAVELLSQTDFSQLICTVERACCYHQETDTSPEADRTGKSPRSATPGSPLLTVTACHTNTLTLSIPEAEFHPWTPETPYLYRFTIFATTDPSTGAEETAATTKDPSTFSDGSVTLSGDRIHSYFAMRHFSVEPDEKGILRFCLNHRPYFLHGLLDQGYWPDGLMTAPCDEAFLFDIRLAKSLGFNMLRKHIKIEPLRWYYHCDRLGMIVWQDMVCGGTSYHLPLVCYMPTLFPHIAVHTRDHHYRLFSRSEEDGRRAWEQECLDTVAHLYNVPSLAVWVPFNEGWGQFDATRIAGLVRQKDPTRPIDHASGWFDQGSGDFKSIHNYFRPLKVKRDRKRAFAITEYGGYACHIPGHSSVERIYGYRKYAHCKELTLAFGQLMEKRLFPLVEKGLSGAVYTQLSDVEEEVNGLVTYDRKVLKILPDIHPAPRPPFCPEKP